MWKLSFFSVTVSVQCNEQDLTYGDEFRIFYEVIRSAVFKNSNSLCFEIQTFIFNLIYFFAQKLPVKDSQSLNYHNKCSQTKPTSTYRPFYGNFSLERGSGWVDDQRPRIWTEAAVQWLTKWFLPHKIPSVNRHIRSGCESQIKRTGDACRKPRKDNPVLLSGCGLNLFSPTRGNNYRTTHYLLWFLFLAP